MSECSSWRATHVQAVRCGVYQAAESEGWLWRPCLARAVEWNHGRHPVYGVAEIEAKIEDKGRKLCIHCR